MDDGRVRVAAPGAGRPLQKVGADELRQLATDATGDDEARVPYIPRILELLAEDAFEEPGRVVDRLVGAPEQEAIRRFLDAWWHDILTRPVGEDRAGTALDAVARLDPDVGPKLAQWAAFSHPNAAAHLLDFCRHTAVALSRGKVPEPVASWLRSEALRTTVAAAADRARTPEERAALEELWLRWLP